MFRYFTVATLCAFLTLSSAMGQILSNAPSPRYRDLTLPSFYSGNFNDTLALLVDDLKNAVRNNKHNQPERWIDSICYWALQGECHYQMARYDDAMRSFNVALQIYIDNADWLKQISLSVQPEQIRRVQMPWGISVRPGFVGNFNRCRFQMSHDRQRLMPIGNEGQTGVATQTTLTFVNAEIVVQSLALTIRRRGEILGSLSKYDPETRNLANVLAQRPHLPNSFTGNWVDVLHGLTLSTLGDDAAAERLLTNGLLLIGIDCDHHLTPVALNELGHIALRNGNADAARTHYLEASFSAHQMGDPVLVGEAFRNMANAHRLIQKTAPLPPIIDASAFFRSERNTSPLTLIPLLHEEAEYNISVRRIAEAKTINDLTGARMRGTKNGVLLDTAHGARYHYLAAAIDYYIVHLDMVAGKKFPAPVLASGNRNLEAALAFLRRASLRLYQLDKLEGFFQSGMITTRGPISERVADELYDEFLRESTDTDWLLQPMDCVAALIATPPAAYERWFAVAFQRGNRGKAFDISEKAKQARFFAGLPLGESRLMAFRLLFESNETELTPEMLLQRQTLAMEFETFNQLSDNVRNIKRQLINVPMAQHTDQQRAMFLDLERQSGIQESALRVMALSRTKVPQIFPPIKTLDQIRKEMPANTAMLVYTESVGTLYCFMISPNSMTVWSVLGEEIRDKPLPGLITDFLHDLGNTAAGQQVKVKTLADQQGKWRESGAKLLWRLLGNQLRPATATELVIVPTGILWYVPFEALSVAEEGQFRPLVTSRQTIRYAPMASLGLPTASGRSVNAQTLVMCGKLMSNDKPEAALEAVNRMSKAGVKNLTVMRTDERTPLPASPSAFASLVQQLVVLDDIPPALPLGWFPFTKKARTPVATWLTLPWGGPRLVVLPAFHTAAESSFKQPGTQNGDDLFLSAMVLQACGARTVLMSRWRTGGRVSYDLVEQFLVQLADKPASEAWQQAIMEVGSKPINLDEEPRVSKEPKVDPPVANHPFFWGAFMLIDRGE